MFFPSNTYQSVMSRFSKALANEKNESHYGKGNFFLTFSERKKNSPNISIKVQECPKKYSTWRGAFSFSYTCNMHFLKRYRIKTNCGQTALHPSIASQLINIVSSIIVTLINRNETKARKDELVIMKKPYNIINQLSSSQLFILIGDHILEVKITNELDSDG